METEPPQGKRFSHAYLARGEPTADNIRMRRRLASLINSLKDTEGLGAEIQKELGIPVPSWVAGYNYGEFLEKCDLKDVLDLITVTRTFLHDKRRSRMYDTNASAKWVSEVARIFQEENVRYRVDPLGGVHFSIDEQFERNRAATLVCLQNARYKNVNDAFESAYTALDEIPPDGKNAIRGTFSAAEGLFRLMFPDAPRLTAKELERLLGPIIQRKYAGNAAATGAALKLLNSFMEWVDSAHFYRHEPGTEEIAQPPLELAINLVSSGASYIRWMAEIDIQAKGA